MEAPVKRSPQATVLSTQTNTDSDVSKKSSVLERFAQLLVTKSQDGGASSSRMKEISSLLSTDIGDDQVVLTVPSLDLRLAEGEHKISALPDMGVSSTTSQNDASTTGAITENDARPSMEASVLSLASSTIDVLEPMAAQNISKQTSWTRSTVCYASNAVGSNISDSFTTLLNSRLRAWTLILLRHSLSTGSGESRSKLLGMLSAKILVESVELKFTTLPLPDAAKGAKPKDSDIILPLLFEVSLQMNLQEKTEKVILRAPGTISAIFHDDCLKLTKVNVQLDTGVFLKSMVEQARIVVLKAVASATETSIPESNVKMLPTKNSLLDVSVLRQSSSLQTSSTKRPTTTELTRQQKARKSALRLNSVLHGKSLKGVSSSINLGSSGGGGSDGLRKAASVRFDSQTLSPKIVSVLASKSNADSLQGQKVNKLESYKSFGRPHGGDYGSGPRNATFGEFGRQGFAGSWGRDGRMVAHPLPSKNSAVDSQGNLVGGSADMNATFESAQFLTPLGGAASSYRSSAASAGAALLGRLSTQPTINEHAPLQEPTLLRTATALENSLMEKLS